DPEKEALFNEVYDTEHVPNLMKVPGVLAVSRAKGEDFAFVIGGGGEKIAPDGPRYSRIYEIEWPHVLTSAARGKAVEEGLWPGQVRPFTRNRRHALYRVIGHAASYQIFLHDAHPI